uniref:Acyltransferase family n=1 Tax=uncultured bacterium contig00005 TaxID=1181497 RepID=A0A806KD63_9BACT|nr:acyltransferase family [uncultured bacterium contig00005]
MSERIKWLSGIRVLAILLVLAYHFFTDYVPGGFIGVDVFLALSGYLITAGAVGKMAAGGGFGYFAFLERRFRRLFPTLLAMVVFCLPLLLLIPAGFATGIARQTAAALGFVTNYYEILNGGSYEARLLPHFFVHTWFLAVEVQVCIVWGSVLAGIGALACHMRVNVKYLTFVLAAALAVASYCFMQILYNANPADPSPGYFNAISHAFPFFIGAMAGALMGSGKRDGADDEAVAGMAGSVSDEDGTDISGGISGKDGTGAGEAVGKRTPRRSNRTLTICGAAAAAAGLVALSLLLDFSAAATYRYGLLAAAVLAVVLIVLLRKIHGFTPQDIREPRVLSFSSDMSYGIYLFHWPLFIVCSNLAFIPVGAVAAGMAFALSLAMAVLVARWVLPVLGARERVRGKIALSLLAVICAVMGGFVFNRAPVINPIEREMYIAYIYQDADGLYDLARTGEFLGAQVGGVGSLGGADGNEGSKTTDPTTPTTPPTATDPATPSTQLPPTGTTPPVTSPPPANPYIPVPPSPPTGSVPPVSPPPTDPPEDTEFLGEVLVIGDSVCLGARKSLLATLPNAKVDTEGSRQVWQGYNLMMKEQKAGRLPEYVVIALGTNVNKNAFDYIDKIVEDIAPGHRLIFVTPYNGKAGASTISYKTAEYIRELPDRFAFVTVADWVETITPHPKAIGADKIHIGGNKEGIALYVDCVTEALWVAAGRPAK